MAKKANPSLSRDLMQASCLLLGGAPVSEVLPQLRRWGVFEGLSLPQVLASWRDEVVDLLEAAQVLGSGGGALLRDAARFVRDDERRLRRVAALERQFAFQGAVVLVLPWAVLALSEEPAWNGLAAAGAAMQLIGCLCFVRLVQSMRRADGGELPALRSLASRLWMRCRAGSGLMPSLVIVGEALGAPTSRFAVHWRQWLEAQKRGAHSSTASGAWPPDLSESESLAQTLEGFLRQGAPATEYLGHYLELLESARQAAWEERLGMLPSQLSLLFCGFFAPAVFLIMLASVWTKLNTLLM